MAAREENDSVIPHDWQIYFTCVDPQRSSGRRSLHRHEGRQRMKPINAKWRRELRWQLVGQTVRYRLVTEYRNDPRRYRLWLMHNAPLQVQALHEAVDRTAYRAGFTHAIVPKGADFPVYQYFEGLLPAMQLCEAMNTEAAKFMLLEA